LSRKSKEIGKLPAYQSLFERFWEIFGSWSSKPAFFEKLSDQISLILGQLRTQKTIGKVFGFETPTFYRLLAERRYLIFLPFKITFRTLSVQKICFLDGLRIGSKKVISDCSKSFRTWKTNFYVIS
jgi:hypothetical protein